MGVVERTEAVGETVEFTTLDGGRIDVEVTEVGGPGEDGDGPVVAALRCEYDTWTMLSDRGWFHLDDVHEDAGFDADEDLELYARLRPALAADLGDDLADVREQLLAGEQPVAHTASWFVTDVLQSVPGPDGRLGEGDVDESIGGEDVEEPLDDGGDEATADAGDGEGPDIGGLLDDPPRQGLSTGWDSFLEMRQVEHALDYVTDYLDAEEFAYEFVDDDLVHFDVQVEEGVQWPMFAHVDEYTRRCTVYAVHPDRVPADRRADAGVLLAQQNYQLERGAFELDAADGEVRYRLSTLPDYEGFEAALNTAMSAMLLVYDDVASYAGNAAAQDRDANGEPTNPDAESGSGVSAYLDTEESDD